MGETQQRVVWLERSGRKILSVDLRSATREEQLQVVDAYVSALERSPERISLLVRGDGKLEYYPDMSTRLKALMAVQENRLRRSALVGFAGIVRVAFDSFFVAARLLGKDVQDRGRHFEDAELEAALDWLAAD
jgi:hypothetical protein